VPVLADVLTSAASWQDEHPLLTYLVPGKLQAELCAGQLVAIPYGDRLVEGIVWVIRQEQDGQDGHDGYAENDKALRPIHTILDLEPVLLPHQRKLAEWIAEYYITPLAQVALMMLPPGLMQRSKIVLRLVENRELKDADGELGGGVGAISEARFNTLAPAGAGWGKRSGEASPPQGVINHAPTDGTLLTTRALIGLLLADGELDVERLKEMLGPKRAKEVLKEATASGLIERDAQLHAPQAHARHKRVVRLVAQGEVLEAWRQRMETQLRESLSEAPVASMAPDNVRRRPKKSIPDPWAIPGVADALTLKPQSRAGLLAQRQLAAVDLLQHNRSERLSEDSLQFLDQPYWTPGMLCKASSLTPAQLQGLVRDNIIAIEEIEIRRDPLLGRTIPASSPLPLTPDQQAALEAIISSNIDLQPGRGQLLPYTSALPTTQENDRETGTSYGLLQVGFLSTETSETLETLETSVVPQGYPGHPRLIGGATGISPILLHGVTGSGKTEVYLQALAAMIAQGKRGIVLVPEIALTAQTVLRFASRFPGRVAIIHSALNIGERYDEWRRIRAGEVDVVIGSRSALFSPLPDLGIIILDEEHEPAYKQDERRPTYHARDAAITLGSILHIPVVLGSATPSVMTFYHVDQKAYRIVELPGRIGATLPPVEVIDLRSELHAGNTSIISRRLQSELEHVLGQGQQAILFLNRRGAASCVLCRECGFVAMCDRCDVPLTYHSTERILLCHYCNRQSEVLHICPSCNGMSMRYFGLGTEKVQHTIQRSFPSARLLRWDRDTARNRRAHEQLLDRFANREADVLIGTQMIAKGLDLPGVTLVGVISADIGLMLPDYSASERTFTLLTQVAGRAGRGEEPGKVIIQTFNPQHFCVDAASRHDYHEFYAAEIEARRRYGYPPFRRFVKFTYSHENRYRSQNEALLLRERLDEWIERLGLTQTDVVGPAPAVMERVRGKYHWQMIARGPDLHPLLRVIDTPGWEVDIDPVSTL
jgi:primosomal protein N' (replication factor Y) (superfamily II helicase)